MRERSSTPEPTNLKQPYLETLQDKELPFGSGDTVRRLVLSVVALLGTSNIILEHAAVLILRRFVGFVRITLLSPARS